MGKRLKKCCSVFIAGSLALGLPGMAVLAKENANVGVVSTYLGLDYMKYITGSREVYVTEIQGYPAQFQLAVDVRADSDEEVVFQVYKADADKADAVWYPARQVEKEWIYILDLSGRQTKGIYKTVAYIKDRDGKKTKIGKSEFEVGTYAVDGTGELGLPPSDAPADDQAVTVSANLPGKDEPKEKAGDSPHIEESQKEENQAEEVIAPGQYPIMGKAFVTADDMVKFYEEQGNPYPGEALSTGGAGDIKTFCQIYYEEATKEGVRPEVAFMQAMLETGWLQYGGDAVVSQFNFAGLGTTGDGVKGNSFPDVRTGIRAQVQHLKAYATTDALNQECVDGRYDFVAKGCAPYVELLGQKENPQGKGWATAERYGFLIVDLIQKLRQ